VRQSALLFAAAGGGIALLGALAIWYLPLKVFGVHVVWVVCTIEIALIGMLWLLLTIARAAGLVETPKARSRD
jgi:hypothetical protein